MALNPFGAQLNVELQAETPLFRQRSASGGNTTLIAPAWLTCALITGASLLTALPSGADCGLRSARPPLGGGDDNGSARPLSPAQWRRYKKASRIGARTSGYSVDETSFPVMPLARNSHVQATASPPTAKHTRTIQEHILI